MIELDYTQMSTFQACELKYYLKFILGLKKRKLDERDIDKNFGQATHTGLAHLYIGKPELLLSAFDKFEDLPEDMEEKHKTKANGIQLLTNYIDHYGRIDKEFEILDVEKVYRTPIKDNLTWISKIDTVIKHRDNIYGLEHKTTKRIQYSYFNHFNPNTQISGETYSIAKKFGQCSGIIVNILQSGYRSRAYKGEPAGFHCAFQREIINRTPIQLEDFRQNTIIWADKIAKAKAGDTWAKEETSCWVYRGCPYREICLTSVGKDLDMEIVENLYEKVDDPFAYLKSGGK